MPNGHVGRAVGAGEEMLGHQLAHPGGQLRLAHRGDVPDDRRRERSVRHGRDHEHRSRASGQAVEMPGQEVHQPLGDDVFGHGPGQLLGEQRHPLTELVDTVQVSAPQPATHEHVQLLPGLLPRQGRQIEQKGRLAAHAAHPLVGIRGVTRSQRADDGDAPTAADQTFQAGARARVSPLEVLEDQRQGAERCERGQGGLDRRKEPVGGKAVVLGRPERASSASPSTPPASYRARHDTTV